MDTATGPRIDGSRLILSLPDASHRLRAVRLVQDAGLTGDLGFVWQRGTWEFSTAVSGIDRLEYLFEIDQNGDVETVLDPTNPSTVDGAFGQKSVVSAAGYTEPAWLREPAVDAVWDGFQFADIEGALWAPDGLPLSDPAPLLVVHDGPEYEHLGSFTQYLGAAITQDRLPPLRAALLAPGDRNVRYSANAEYAEALCCGVVAPLREVSPVVIGIGASLGALAMLHAHTQHPGTFDGLMLQSGSFFTPELDSQERDFSGFEAVTAFVSGFDVADLEDVRPVPTVITCGIVEENLANNRRMAKVLTELTFPVEFEEVRDAHNYTAWRDALDPHLTHLVQRVIGDAHAA